MWTPDDYQNEDIIAADPETVYTWNLPGHLHF